jgi:predicted RNase H-like HicB family nuclease
MRLFTAVIERCPETGLYVGYVPGFPDAHSQGSTLDELHENLREVITMLMVDGEPAMESQFVGTQILQVS